MILTFGPECIKLVPTVTTGFGTNHHLTDSTYITKIKKFTFEKVPPGSCHTDNTVPSLLVTKRGLNLIRHLGRWRNGADCRRGFLPVSPLPCRGPLRRPSPEPSPLPLRRKRERSACPPTRRLYGTRIVFTSIL